MSWFHLSKAGVDARNYASPAEIVAASRIKEMFWVGLRSRSLATKQRRIRQLSKLVR